MPLDISNYFQSRRNQFEKNTQQRLFRSNPFRSLVPMEPFNLEDGVEPTIRTYTHELPTAYPSALTAVPAESTGTGNVACQPSATTIKRGETHRTYGLTQVSFDTDVVCLSDIKRAVQAAEAASAWEKALKEYTTVFWGDWYRMQNIAMVDTKATTTSATDISVSTSTLGNHTQVSAIPSQDLNWTHLNQLYFDLVRRGVADEYAVGVDSKGRPIIPLIAGPGIIQALFKNDLVKEQVKFFDPKSNLALLGYDGAVNGFLPVVDLFPVRYGHATPINAVAGLTAANMIYPTTNANATIGRKHQPNPNYLPAARGGIAQFEVVTLLPKNVYEARYESAEPSKFSQMKFDPVSYVGDFSFVNNKTFKGDNDRGNLGYYMADIRVGAKPLNPDLGISLITRVIGGV